LHFPLNSTNIYLTVPVTPLNDAPQGGSFAFYCMKFVKTAKAPEQLITLLKSRGLHIDDETQAKKTLQYIGYYRFSGYAYPFLVDKQHHIFKSGISFKDIVDCYTFDREFRLLLSDALERIEIAIRTAILDYMSQNVNPHWFLEARHFLPQYVQKDQNRNNLSKHDDFLKRIEDNTRRSSDIFFKHYYQKYTDPKLPPSWMTFEALEFGTLSFLFSNLQNKYKTEIAKKFNLSRRDLKSWLHSLSTLRNLCAHHSRVWNRNFAILPDTSGKYKHHFYHTKKVSDFLVVIQIFLNQIASQSTWKYKLQKLIDDHSTINIQYMGLPQHWLSQALWR
jgi:abortive infection bacteriophage resistance protein